MHRFHGTTAHSELLICAILYTQKTLLTLHGTSGAGTNLKVGGHRSGAKVGGGHWKVGGTGPVLCWKNFFWSCPGLHFFGSKSTISHVGERFHDGQYSLISFLFAVPLLTVPPVPGHL